MLQEIANGIILVAAVIAAIGGILKVFGKPIKFFDRKQKERQRAITVALMDELVPKYFADNCSNLRAILDKVTEIEELNQEQSATLDLLRHNLQDILRQQIENIYDKYHQEQAFPLYIKENLDELYADYKAANGNHHIDKLYKRMEDWEVINITKYDLD